MKKILLFISIAFTINFQAQDKLLSSINQFHNGSNLQNSYGSNYEYDSNNNLTVQTDYIWFDNIWHYSSKETFTYNANNRVVFDTYQQWNSVTNMFENQYFENYIYNANNNVEEIISKGWNGSQWVNNNRTIITYTNNLIIEFVGYDWNGSQWVNDGKGTFTYNSNNKITGNLEYKWIDGNWAVSSRDSYTYNSNGKLVTTLNEKFESNNWVGDYDSNYTLDIIGNRSSETESYNYLADKTKTDYNYDTSASMSSFAHPFKDKTGLDYIFEEMPFISKLTSSNNFTYNTATNSFDSNGVTTYNYNALIVLSNEDFDFETEVIKVFPNPTDNFVQFSGLTENKNYEIYNVLGAQLKKGTVNNNEKIDIQNLRNGLYLIKFNNGNTVKIKKN